MVCDKTSFKRITKIMPVGWIDLRACFNSAHDLACTYVPASLSQEPTENSDSIMQSRLYNSRQ